MKYPSIGFAEEAMRQGGTMPAVMNAANEVAVQAFVEGRLSFPGIWETVENTLAAASPEDYHGQLDIILSADAWAREYAGHLISLA